MTKPRVTVYYHLFRFDDGKTAASDLVVNPLFYPFFLPFF